MADISAVDDAVLISRAREGDDQAFSALWQRHEGAARRLAGTYARNDADRDDLVSTAFERVLGAMRRGGGPDESFRAYLFVTLRRAAAETAKRREEPPPEGLIDLAVEAEEAPLAGEERETVVRAFESLPDRWQTVLWHTAVEGRTPRELAPRLGISPNAAAASAYRAREKLRQAYLQAHLQQQPRPDCEPFAAQLGAYVRSGLSARDHAKVESHLEECEHCRALSAELQEVNSLLLRALLPLMAPAGIKAALAAGAAGAAGAGIAGGSGSKVVRWLSGRAGPGPQAGALAGAAATVAAAVVAGMALAGALSGSARRTDLAGSTSATPSPSSVVSVPSPPATAAAEPPAVAAPAASPSPPGSSTPPPTIPARPNPPPPVVPPTPPPPVVPAPVVPPPPATTTSTTTTTTTTTTTVVARSSLELGGNYSANVPGIPGIRSLDFVVIASAGAPAAATGVTVTLRADAGNVTVSPKPGWSCTPAASVVRCSYASPLHAGTATSRLPFYAPAAHQLTLTATAANATPVSVTLPF